KILTKSEFCKEELMGNDKGESHHFNIVILVSI
ncbi:MAG: hypothetical protein QG646_1216, partial [Euryarchaeota archaeon]|nr:hypothetical protein [Euryarchaeota archaeon]